mmetsp:Transcript_590/g.1517  ORF Transcript_590/g.1517 Transcript_590/m.1517 type:complete len:136 (-) Transcript_590:2233-2640(-)
MRERLSKRREERPGESVQLERLIQGVKKQMSLAGRRINGPSVSFSRIGVARRAVGHASTPHEGRGAEAPVRHGSRKAAAVQAAVGAAAPRQPGHAQTPQTRVGCGDDCGKEGQSGREGSIVVMCDLQQTEARALR